MLAITRGTKAPCGHAPGVDPSVTRGRVLGCVVVEILARTGLRAGELCDLAADAVTQIGDDHWLRVPVGKLRNDRYIPLHPDLVDLLADWTADNVDHIRPQRRLIADHRGTARPTHRRTASSAASPARPGSAASTPTSCATPSPPKPSTGACALEAIAALLGHRSMEMTLTYARIADRVVADEYAAVHAQIDALYGQTPPAPSPPTSRPPP